MPQVRPRGHHPPALHPAAGRRDVHRLELLPEHAVHLQAGRQGGDQGHGPGDDGHVRGSVKKSIFIDFL